MNATTCLTQDSLLIAEKPAKATIYTPLERQRIDTSSLPRHIAFIPDGNRRWAEKNREFNRNASFGHRSGADTLMDIVKAAKELGVKVVTFYSFSTENWLRRKEEVDALMWLFHTYLIANQETMLEEGIRLGVIGDLSKIPNPAQETILETQEMTSACSSIDMVLAINYGGRDEIARAVRKIALAIEQGEISSEEINENVIAKHLDTSPYGDPELLVRTSGEMRISNFLNWQLSYTELYVANVLWPEFSSKHLLDAVVDYQKRDRRHGN